MSNATLPNTDDAFATASDLAHNVFFGQLAQRGYQPQSQKEAQDLLEMAGTLRAYEDQHQLSGDSPISQAKQALDRMIGGDDYENRQQAQAVKSAASQLAENPDIYNAILSLKAAEADQVAAQLGLGDDAGDAGDDDA